MGQERLFPSGRNDITECTETIRSLTQGERETHNNFRLMSGNFSFFLFFFSIYFPPLRAGAALCRGSAYGTAVPAPAAVCASGLCHRGPWSCVGASSPAPRFTPCQHCAGAAAVCAPCCRQRLRAGAVVAIWRCCLRPAARGDPTPSARPANPLPEPRFSRDVDHRAWTMSRAWKH